MTKVNEAGPARGASTGSLCRPPFPGMGQQTRFRDEMTRIMPMLPKNEYDHHL
jgi:hypothetical protein